MPRLRRIWVLLTLAAVLTALLGCTAPEPVDGPGAPVPDYTPPRLSPAPPAEGADIVGAVLDIREEERVCLLIHSESAALPGSVWIMLTAQTRYPHGDRNFQIGDRVAVLCDGPVMESSPMEAFAASVWRLRASP